MTTVQKVILVPHMGLLENNALLKWAKSLSSDMIAKSNQTANAAFEAALYERNMPRQNEVMIGVMPFTFFRDDPVFRKSVYLFGLLVKPEIIIDDPNCLAGQIAMVDRGSEFYHQILVNCMKIKQTEGELSVGYPLSSHPVVKQISMIAFVSMIADMTIHGQDTKSQMN